MSQLYRSGKLGESLVDALDTLLSEGKITETLAIQVLAEVWTFVLSDATLRVTPTLGSSKKDEEEVVAEGPLKLVLVDAKVVKFDHEDGPEGGGSGALQE